MIFCWVSDVVATMSSSGAYPGRVGTILAKKFAAGRNLTIKRSSLGLVWLSLIIPLNYPGYFGYAYPGYSFKFYVSGRDVNRAAYTAARGRAGTA